MVKNDGCRLAQVEKTRRETTPDWWDVSYHLPS